MPEFPTEPGNRILEQTRSNQRDHLAPETIDSYQQQYLSFRLNDEWYGLSVYDLVEVLPPPQIARVPRVPGHVLGVINLRGEVLAAIDLKRLLGLPRPATEIDPAIIVVEKGEVRTGLLVDGIGELVSLARDDFTEEPVLAGKSQPTFFEGAAHWGGVLVSIVRLEGLLRSGCCCW